jgi:hypothetical protein
MTPFIKKRSLIVVIVVLVIAGISFAWSVQNKGKAAALRSSKAAVDEAVFNAPGFASIADYDKMAKENAGIQLKVPEYTVNAGLANVVNRNIYGSLLEPDLARMILQRLQSYQAQRGP